MKKWITRRLRRCCRAFGGRRRGKQLTTDGTVRRSRQGLRPNGCELPLSACVAGFAEVRIPPEPRFARSASGGRIRPRGDQPVSAALGSVTIVTGMCLRPRQLGDVRVTDVERSGRVKGRARVAYRFNSVRAGGERYDIETSSIAHLAPATKGADATKIAIGAGAGAAVGAILGGGDGAAKGAAVGGPAHRCVLARRQGNTHGTRRRCHYEADGARHGASAPVAHINSQRPTSSSQDAPFRGSLGVGFLGVGGFQRGWRARHAATAREIATATSCASFRSASSATRSLCFQQHLVTGSVRVEARRLPWPRCPSRVHSPARGSMIGSIEKCLESTGGRLRQPGCAVGQRARRAKHSGSGQPW